VANDITLTKNINKFYFCTSKVWVLKFSNWVILSIYIFDLGCKDKKKKYRKYDSKCIEKVNSGFKDIFSYQSISKKSRKLKKFITKKNLKRVKVFFLNTISSKKKLHNLSTIKILKNVFKKRNLKKKAKRKIFKKINLNTRLYTLMCRKKEHINKSSTHHTLKEMYAFF